MPDKFLQFNGEIFCLAIGLQKYIAEFTFVKMLSNIEIAIACLSFKNEDKEMKFIPILWHLVFAKICQIQEHVPQKLFLPET